MGFWIVEFVFGRILRFSWNVMFLILICIWLMMFCKKFVMNVGSDRVWLVLVG